MHPADTDTTMHQAGTDKYVRIITLLLYVEDQHGQCETDVLQIF